MSSATQRITVLRIVAWSLVLVAVIILALFGFGLLYALPNLSADFVQQSIVLGIAAIVVGMASDRVFKYANNQNKDIDERLLGFVMTSEAVTFDELAAWVRVSQVEVANRLGRIASTGGLTDFMIDLSNRMVTKASKRPFSEPRPISQSPPAPAQTPAAAPMPSEPDEVIRIKAKLYELEVLKQQGKIGQPAYDKLKEEYEKKLAQSDKGTQVY